MMARPTMLQSRIDAFENMAATTKSSSAPAAARSIPKYPPSSSPNLLEAPISPKASSLCLIAPNTPPQSASVSPSPSPPSLGRKTSLIDLRDWVVEDGLSSSSTWNAHASNGKPKDPKQTPTKYNFGERANNARRSPPIISLEAPTKHKPSGAPPLPPRGPYTSLKSASSHSSVSTRNEGSNPSTHAPQSSARLTVEHTYPPLSMQNVSDVERNKKGHVPASSISSFHSVSLSSDGGTPDASTTGASSQPAPQPSADQDRHDDDSFSLDESFENVSATSVISPASASAFAINWEKARANYKPTPPQLPQRPASCQPLHSPPITPALEHLPHPSSSSTARRPVPPPPACSRAIAPPPTASSRSSATASDRASIRSNTSRSSNVTTTSKQVLLRPTPVPAATRTRYEAVFMSNILQWRRLEKMRSIEKEKLASHKKSRQAVGWRGLSVDLITNPLNTTTEARKAEPEEPEIDQVVGSEDRLEGVVVRLIWNWSRLENVKLKAIWSECDPSGGGTLDRDSFVKGMWRIDEELRRMRSPRQASSHSVFTPHRPRQVPPKPAGTKLILR